MSRIQPKAIRDRTKEAPPSSSTRIAAVAASARKARQTCALRRNRPEGQFHSPGDIPRKLRSELAQRKLDAAVVEFAFVGVIWPYGLGIAVALGD